MSNSLYDILKKVVTIIIPALITFLGVVLPVCGVPQDICTIIVTILGAIATFIGTVIGISSANYHEAEKEETEG